MITIIIPTYNRAHLLQDSIDSIIKQTFTNWELIIVDDGSTDDTYNVVKNFNDPKIVYAKRPLDKPKGANACRNHGYYLAKGQFIKWLDSDDLLEANCLEVQYEKLIASKSDANICRSRLFQMVNNDMEILERTWSPNLTSTDVAGELVEGKLRWPVLAGLWRKTILPQMPFHEGIQNSQDWLFHIEMSLKSNVAFSFVEQSLCLIRVQDGSMSHAKNTNGNYYYHSSLARFYAIEQLYIKKFSRNARLYLLKKFFRFQFFTLYKGSLEGFLRLTLLLPKIIYKTFV